MTVRQTWYWMARKDDNGETRTRSPANSSRAKHKKPPVSNSELFTQNSLFAQVNHPKKFVSRNTDSMS